MIREIKFRSWDKKDNIMRSNIEGRYWTGLELESGKLVHIKEGKIVDAPTRLIIMQYTGLKDKNGKEIYEGDILRDLNGSKGNASDIQMRGDGGMGWWLENEDGQLSIPSEPNREVIGNIYENPELLPKHD